ncbi:hypothetical protein [Rhodococcus spongiicola]|uniref:Uncharacterized protein n=1 Tax=Rhodococcus spongiicola TaxID=2487352 RepID=A0A3S3CST9_9NOCA|nr:hypothetical protein [Rhodococcus spongiicola]RVW04783.1 hypothetical protein EF834_07185 [Rhodococcus spongiicola]
MIKSVRAVATAALATPLLATMFAAPANAGVKDVTLSVEVHGNDVEVIIINDSQRTITCKWMAESDRIFGETYAAFFQYVESDEEYRYPVTVADGTYTVNWNCTTPLAGETWGTTWETGRKTAEPLVFTAPGSTDDDSTGFGSLGSTSGSFGSS